MSHFVQRFASSVSVFIGGAVILSAGCAPDGNETIAEPEAAGVPAVAPPAETAPAETAPAETAPLSACERVADLALDDAVIETAEAVAVREAQIREPGLRTARADVPHCRVAGVIDATIRFELLLPDDWNGKFMMGGGGGFVGSVQNQVQDELPSGATPLDLGYATAGTDTGHQAPGIDASWALNDPKAQADFAHVAVHRTAEVSKAIIGDYYAGEIDYSYFLGCSRGGGQALIEAQRYPGDFDGIVAGAPALDWTGIAAGMIQNQQAIFPDPTDLSLPVITDDNRNLLAASIREQCDTIDGVADGVLNDPRSCPFDPATLPRCEGEAGPGCLTEEQLAAVQTVYRGPVVDDESVHPGFPFGGETVGWPLWITRQDDAALPTVPNLHFAFGTQLFKHFVYSDPDWMYDEYSFDDWAEASAPVAALLNATDPDLSAFDESGGKLILWHGWSDAALSAYDSIDYHDAVAALDPNAGEHFRMFLMPGVAHCSGGPGPDRVDWISAIERWVEDGEAPERLIASKVDAEGNTTMQRPLCPYPEEAVYDGSGDPNAAESFACAIPR